MTKLEMHPTVRRFREREARPEAHGTAAPDKPMDESWLRRLCEEAGVDDVGFVAIDRPEIDDQRAEILSAFPATRTLISFVCRLNREPIRSPARSAANQEFHANYDHVNEVARRIVQALERAGVPAMNPSAAFPMEMDRYPGRIWIVSHKPVAVAAGLGQVGIHRCVIHPVFGSFINLGTILVAGDVSKQDAAIDYNPCVECKLCVAIRASLYAPLRVLLYQTDDGKTCVEYDRPSSLFGQFGDDRVTHVAEVLDRKLEDLAKAAIG